MMVNVFHILSTSVLGTFVVLVSTVLATRLQTGKDLTRQQWSYVCVVPDIKAHHKNVLPSPCVLCSSVWVLENWASCSSIKFCCQNYI